MRGIGLALLRPPRRLATIDHPERLWDCCERIATRPETKFPRKKFKSRCARVWTAARGFRRHFIPHPSSPEVITLSGRHQPLNAWMYQNAPGEQFADRCSRMASAGVCRTARSRARGRRARRLLSPLRHHEVTQPCPFRRAKRSRCDACRRAEFDPTATFGIGH